MVQQRVIEFTAPSPLEPDILHKRPFAPQPQPLQQPGCRPVLGIGDSHHPVQVEVAKQIIQQPAYRFGGKALPLEGAGKGKANLRLARIVAYIVGQNLKGTIADETGRRFALNGPLILFSLNTGPGISHVVDKSGALFCDGRFPTLVAGYFRIRAVGGKWFYIAPQFGKSGYGG
jgi:hypothetical protein